MWIHQGMLLCFLLSVSDVKSSSVSCGRHRASSCSECPQGNGANWCNGECTWTHQQCVPSGVSCGRHRAPSCFECPRGNGANWCNGECTWTHQQCVPSEFSTPYSYARDQTKEAWFLKMEMDKSLGFKELWQANFTDGTLRIKTGGYYRLMEDISFNPMRNGTHIEFPLDSDHDNYPQGQYLLGFFAAITIESRGVWLDLNGKTIGQGVHNYIKQRFFSTIELADRIFINSEGTSSLNYHANDHLHFDKSRPTSGPDEKLRKVGELISAEETVIENGVIGRTSHAGIHGNGMKKIVIQNVVIKNFEVTGAQFNGGDDITMKNVTVGPASSQVPAFGYLSSVIYLVRHLVDIIPRRWKNVDVSVKGEENNIEDLLETEVSFADRPGQTAKVKEVFKRAGRAVDLYVHWAKRNIFNKESPIEVQENDEELLKEALLLFNKRLESPHPLKQSEKGRFTDGGTLYGLQFHRLGASVGPLGKEQSNYYGPTVGNVWLEDVTVKDLVGNMRMVPSIVSASGKMCKGTNDEVIPILDFLGDQGSGRHWASPKMTFYRGNFLLDTYVAELILSSKYFRRTIWDSACGSFASNHSSPEFGPKETCKTTENISDAPLKGEYGTFPGPNHGSNAFLESNRNYSYTGRDTVMFQKKYFGGTQCSNQFLEWATTPGASLDSMLAIDPNPLERRRKQHKVTCNQDIMVHASKGIIGIRMGFQGKAHIKNVTINNLVNIGNNNQFVCEKAWLNPTKLGRYAGADVSGVRFQKNTLVTIDGLEVDKLDSIKGKAVGIAILGDSNDRSDWEADGLEYKFKEVVLGQLKAGNGQLIVPFETQASFNQFLAGMNVTKQETTLNHNYDLAKKSYVFVSRREVPCGSDGGASNQYVDPEQVNFGEALSLADLSLKEREGLSRQTASFFNSHYGVEFKNMNGFNDFLGRDFENADPVGLTVHEETDVLHGLVICDAADCKDIGGFELNQFAITMKPKNEFYNTHGVYGDFPLQKEFFIEQKFSGQEIDNTSSISAGGYTLTNDKLLCGENNKHVLQFHGHHPRTLSNPIKNLTASPINDVLESRVLGPGKSDGVIFTRKNEHGKCIRTRWQLWQFDDSSDAFPSNSEDGCTGKTKVQPEYERVLVATGDGCGEGRRSMGGLGFFPLGNDHFKGAPFLGTEGAFKEWLKMNDSTILELRSKFIDYLASYVGHQFRQSNVENMKNDILYQTQGTAVGSGNSIKMYEVNQDHNMRVLISKLNDANGNSIKSYRKARIHEVGFVFSVGAGGTLANFDGQSKKYFYKGAQISWGFYIIENIFKNEEVDRDNEAIVLEFQGETLWNPTIDMHMPVERDIVGVYRLKEEKKWEEREVLDWGKGKVEGIESSDFNLDGNRHCVNIKLFFSWK